MWCSKLEHSEYNSTTEPNPLATALLVITITTPTTSITMPNLLPSYCLVYTTCLKWLSFSSVNANVCDIAKVLFKRRTIRQLVRQIYVFIPTTERPKKAMIVMAKLSFMAPTSNEDFSLQLIGTSRLLKLLCIRK